MNKSTRIIGRLGVLDCFDDGLNMIFELVRTFRKVAENAGLGDAMVEHFRFEHHPWLLVREPRADGHLDLEHPAVKVCHGTAKVRQLPNEGIFVHEIDVEGDHVVLLVTLHNLLKLSLEH